MTVGGTDAGEKMRPWYAIAEREFPILADSIEILEDTPAGTFGLAWFRGDDTKGTTTPLDDEPRFAVRDDIDVDAFPYIPFHEAGHAFAEIVARTLAIQRGLGDNWPPVYDEIRTRYWTMRGFPGTWQDAQAVAIQKGWFYYPDESFADCFAHAMLFLHPIPGYVTGEWTNNFNGTPVWQTPDKAVNFMRELMNEAYGGDDLPADPQVLALLQQIAKNTQDTFDKVNALAPSISTWLDRLGDGRDVASGGTDKTATKP